MNDVTISMQPHTISRRRREFRVIHVLSRDGKRILDTRSHTDIPADPLLSMCRHGKPGPDGASANAPTRRTWRVGQVVLGARVHHGCEVRPGGHSGPVRHQRPGARWPVVSGFTRRQLDPAVPSRQPRASQPRNSAPRIGFLITCQTLQRADRVLRPRPAGHDAARSTGNLPAIGSLQRRSLLPGARLPAAPGSAVFLLFPNGPW
jgi:hypothetical protein